MAVKKGNAEKYYRPAQAIDDEQRPDLRSVHGDVSVTCEDRDNCHRCELERVHIEKNGEEEYTVHYYSIGVTQCEPPEKVGMCDPDEVQRGEAQCERDEQSQVGLKLPEIARHFQADDEQCCRKGEHRVGERLDARRFMFASYGRDGCHVSAL